MLLHLQAFMALTCIKHENFYNWTNCKLISTVEKSVQLKIIFLIFQDKHMLWVLN